jgi:hypothetical protein
MPYPKIVWLLIGLSGIANAALWLLAWTLFPIQDPNIVLHYTTGGGIDFIGQGSTIFNLPLAGLLLLVLNTFIGVLVYRVERPAAWLVWAIMPLIQVSLLVGFFLLLYVNTHPYG